MGSLGAEPKLTFYFLIISTELIKSASTFDFSSHLFLCFGEIIEGLRWVGDRNQAGTGDREHLQKSNACDGL